LRILRGDAPSAHAPGLSALELVPCELAIPADLRFTHIFRGRREMLDHVFLSKSLLQHFSGARVLNEDLKESDELPPAEAGGWTPDPYTTGSDHAPFVITLRV